MNRREFIAAVGAVPVAAYLPELLAEVPTLTKAQYMESWYTKLYPWQQSLWRVLERGKRVMYITSTEMNALNVYNRLQRHKNLFCTRVNGAVMGRQADIAIIDDFADDINQEWYDSCVRTRLSPGNVDNIEWIHT